MQTHSGAYYYWKRKANELGLKKEDFKPRKRRSSSSEPAFQPSYPSSWNHTGETVYYNTNTMRPRQPPRSATSSPYHQMSYQAPAVGYGGYGPSLAPPQHYHNCIPPTNPGFSPQVQYFPPASPQQFAPTPNYAYPPQVQQGYPAPPAVNVSPYPYNPQPQNSMASGFYRPAAAGPAHQISPPPPYEAYQQQAFNPDFGK